jgi:CBS domain containing-hemolysin-like protein
MVDSPAWAWVSLFVTFTLLTAIAAATQATLHYMGRAKLRHMLQEGTGRAQALQRAFEEPTLLYSTCVVVNTVAVTGSVASGLVLAWSQWNVAPVWGAAVGFVLLACMLLVQLVARALAVYRPERAMILLVQPMRWLSIALWPLVAPVTALEQRLLTSLRIAPSPDAAAAEEELRLLVETAEEHGGLEDEREMIHGIFTLSQRPVREIMVPRIDMVAVERGATVQEVLSQMRRTGHSRFPMFDGSVDHIIGVIHAKDVLRHLEHGTAESAAEPLARPAFFVPETKKIDELLTEMRQKKTQLAIVLDEYGGTAGLVTIEDMVEEIVGEIQDEHDIEEALFERISEHEAVFDARMNIHDVGDVLGIDLAGELEEHEFDTIGGLVYDRLGKVPTPGDEVRVNGCQVTVLTTQGHRIKKVRVLMGSPSGTSDGEPDE